MIVVVLGLLAACSSKTTGPQPVADAAEAKALLDGVTPALAERLVEARRAFEAQNPGGPPSLPKADGVTSVTVPCPGGGSLVVQVTALPGPLPFNFGGTARLESCAFGDYVLSGELAVTVRGEGAGFVLELSGQLTVSFGGRTLLLEIEKLTITWGSTTTVCYSATVKIGSLSLPLHGGTAGCSGSPDAGVPSDAAVTPDGGKLDRGASSPDGNTTMGGFTKRSSSVTGLGCLIWDGARYVAGGARAALAESADGLTWTAMSNTGIPSDATIRSLAYSAANKRYVALLSRTSPSLTYVYTLTQGQSSWKDLDHGVNGHQQVLWAGDPVGAYVLLTSQLYRSADGLTWTITDTGAWQTPYAIAWGGTGAKVLVAGDGGTIFTSPDATTWTPHNAGTMNRIAAAAGLGKRWVIMLAANAGLYSSVDDAASWKKVTLPRGGKVHSVHRAGDRFLVTTVERQAYFSTDGETYTGGDVFLPSQVLAAAANGDGPRIVVLAGGGVYTAEK